MFLVSDMVVSVVVRKHAISTQIWICLNLVIEATICSFIYSYQNEDTVKICCYFEYINTPVVDERKKKKFAF